MQRLVASCSFRRASGCEMQVELEAIEAQVLKLSTQDRARLLDRLILSLDEDKVRDEAWNALAAARDAEIESGQVAEIDGAEALARFRAKHG
jgi:hypothetical protein